MVAITLCPAISCGMRLTAVATQQVCRMSLRHAKRWTRSTSLLVRLTLSFNGPLSGLILFFSIFSTCSVFDGIPRRGRWWDARARCDLKPPSKATRTCHNPGELMLTTALRPSSDCKLCTPSSVTQSPPLLLVASTSTHLRPVRAGCVERRVEQHTIEAVLLQPNCFHTNGSRHRSRFSRWLHWS